VVVAIPAVEAATRAVAVIPVVVEVWVVHASVEWVAGVAVWADPV
jgi:hypothetical protein